MRRWFHQSLILTCVHRYKSYMGNLALSYLTGELSFSMQVGMSKSRTPWLALRAGSAVLGTSSHAERLVRGAALHSLPYWRLRTASVILLPLSHFAGLADIVICCLTL